MRRGPGRMPEPGQHHTKDEKGASNDFLERIYDIVGSNFDDSEFGVEELAKLLNVYPDEN